MAGNYFSRLHFSIRSNPKTALLTDGAFRLYILLLTLNGDGSIGRGVPDSWVASQCGRSLDEVLKLRDELAGADLLPTGSWAIKNYVAKQYRNFEQSKRDAENRASKKSARNLAPTGDKKSARNLAHPADKKTASKLAHVEVEEEEEEEEDIEEEIRKSPNNRDHDKMEGSQANKNPEAEEAARRLGELMLGNDPEAKLPKTQKQKDTWVQAMERLHRIDSRPWQEINDVLDWCQKDHFWHDKILSAPKFRIQFPKLRLAMRRGNGKAATVTDINKQAVENYIKGLVK